MHVVRRYIIAAIGFSLLARAGCAWALDPERSLGQLHHTSWTIENGAPPDIWALAQSPDGYLWLGTGAGLYRFDGVRFEKFRAVNGTELPSNNVNALFAATNGDIWVGLVTGDVSRVYGGQLTTYALGCPGASVNQLAVDRDKVVWAALRGNQHGALARFAAGQWHIVAGDWGLPAEAPASSVLAARDGNLWAAVNRTLYVLHPGSKRFLPDGEKLLADTRVLEAPDGRIWLSSSVGGGPHALDEAGPNPTPRLTPPPALATEANRVIIDREGVLWGSNQLGGVFRIGGASQLAAGLPTRAAAPEIFGLKDGLSSDLATPLLEDREGNIWIGTNLGLDRFRATNVVPEPGLPVTSRAGFTAARDGQDSVYVASGDTLFRARRGQPAERLTHLAMAPSFLAAEPGGEMWAGFNDGLATLKGARLDAVALPAAAQGRVAGWTRDASGRICISVLRKGVFCQAGNAWPILPFTLDSAHPAPGLIAFDGEGRLWLDYDDELAMLDGTAARVFSARDGLLVGGIDVVTATADGVLVGGEFGLARFAHGRFDSVGPAQNLGLRRITGIVQTAGGDTWLNGIAGVLRIRTDALNAAFEHPDLPLQAATFDLADGLPGVAQQDSDTQTALQAGDGRIWLVTSHGVAWIDPQHMTRNTLPPPVSIRAVIANGTEYLYPKNLTLPAGLTNLEIDYTALSLSIPERVRFRYKLDGVDNDWIDPGTRRQAFYTKLAPGAYQFHVLASNNDGVWNTTGATLSFSMPPTFLQSALFKAIVAVGVLTVLWALYQLRLRQMARRIRERLEERLSERDRIARELHDTLLQGFQGLILRFQAATEQIEPAHEARQTMETALDLADEVLAEGRRRVTNLRTQNTDVEMSELFAASARKLLAGSKIALSVFVEGKARPLHPVVREEITRIGLEALSNALAHSGAETIELGVVYHARELRLAFRDNGIGIDPEILANGFRRHHFGMIGMRERASKIRGVLTITSRQGSGTEVTLSVPAAIAYSRPGDRMWRTLHRDAMAEV